LKENRKQVALDAYFQPMKEMTSIKSFDREEGAHPWMVLNGQELHYQTIKKHMCFALTAVAKFIKLSYETVKKAFQRICKKTFDDIDDDYFVEGKDYIILSKKFSDLRDKMSPNAKKKGRKEEIFLTYLGMWKLIGSFRKDYPIWVYHKMGEREYNRILCNTYKGDILEFNVGTELHELYRKYEVFLKTIQKITSPIERWFYGWAWDKIDDLEWQYPIDKLTVDFAASRYKVAIECDGKDYHSSVDQRNRDNNRDAFLHSEGWVVQRFTGNQIYNDVDACVQKVLGIIAAQKLKLGDFF